MKRLIAYVWTCGDDWCDCSQAVIQAHHQACRHIQYDGTEGHRVVVPYLWEGEFRTDHAPGSWPELESTLEAMRTWPDVAMRLPAPEEAA